MEQATRKSKVILLSCFQFVWVLVVFGGLGFFWDSSTKSRESSLLSGDIAIPACMIHLHLNSGISEGISFFKQDHSKALCCNLKGQPAPSLQQGEGWSSQAFKCPLLLLQGKAYGEKKSEQAPPGCCCPGPPHLGVMPHRCQAFLPALRKSAQGTVRHCFPLLASQNLSVHNCT